MPVEKKEVRKPRPKNPEKTLEKILGELKEIRKLLDNIYHGRRPY